MIKRKRPKPTTTELLFSFLKDNQMIYILLSLLTVIVAFGLFRVLSPQKEYLNDNTIKIVVLIATISLGVLPLLIKFLYDDKDKKKDNITLALKRQEFYERQKTFDDNIREAIQRSPEVLNVEKAVYEKII